MSVASLTIAMLGWSWPPLGASEGSGLNLNMGELAAALVERGHRVVYLRSGITYSLRPGMRVNGYEPWRGVGLFDAENAPNVATGNFNFDNVRGQVRSSRHTRLVMEWLEGVRPDVVHVHSMEGFAFELIGAMRGRGWPVVVTAHNYYWLCPQIDLFERERRVCADYDGGRLCVGCLRMPAAGSERRARRLVQTIRRRFGSDPARRLEGALRAQTGPGETAEVAAGTAAPLDRVDKRSDELRLLAARSHLVVVNEYGERRAAAVRALNACSAVLCPSRCLLDVHAAMGVRPEVLRLVRLGQPHFDVLRREAEASPGYGSPPWVARTSAGPLRFAFFGNVYPNKGLHVLASAIERLPPEVHARASFLIHASGGDGPFRERLARFPNVRLGGAYAAEDLPRLAREYDVGLFPNQGLDNSPFVMLEYLHAGKFAVCSELGGPRGWIVPGGNGVLVKANDPAEWGNAIEQLVRGHIALPSPCEIHGASVLPSFAEYVPIVEQEYASAART